MVSTHPQNIVCTLTWWSNSEGYEVFFNRDERKGRKPALPPSVQTNAAGDKYLAATDGDAGGTWLLANAHGISLAILNYYEREPDETDTQSYRSRGLLVTDLASCRSLEDIHKRLSQEEMPQYKAFTLMGFQLDSHIRVWLWRWDGSKLIGPELDPTMPVCSSSFLTAEVVAQRERMLEDILLSGPMNEEMLDEFHHQDDGGKPSAYTVRMNRDDAQTWSISRLRVTHLQASFRYEALQRDHIGESEFFSAELQQVG